MEKHYLASANSCKGFINFFDNINPDKNGFTYILKGGPGTGKSTIMKKFGKTYQDKGYSVEYFYCSSDPESLDGVKILKKNISIVDGTAPHVTEASMPGLKEKIVNVGEFIKPTLKKHKKIIENLLSKKAENFKLAYSNLKAVSGIINAEKLEFKKLGITNIDLNEKVSLIPQNQIGSERKLFCSYVTSKGIEYLYDKNEIKHTNILPSSFLQNTKTLDKLAEKLTESNFNFISFMSILDPSLREAIYVEESKTLVLAFDPKKSSLETFKNKTIIEKLLKQAGKYIEKARYYHKKVEKYYIENMDFDGLNKYINEIEKELY